MTGTLDDRTKPDPGPWLCHPTAYMVGLQSVRGEWDVDGPRRRIAVVNNAMYNAEANAALMAAAPQMLEALQAVCRDVYQIPDGGLSNKSALMVEKAIAKATGK